jgi:hypothetical protein
MFIVSEKWTYIIPGLNGDEVCAGLKFKYVLKCDARIENTAIPSTYTFNSRYVSAVGSTGCEQQLFGNGGACGVQMVTVRSLMPSVHGGISHFARKTSDNTLLTGMVWKAFGVVSTPSAFPET